MDDKKLVPSRFIEEPIEVFFEETPVFEKKPSCPHHFIWSGITFTIQELLLEWHVYERKGWMAKNMQPQHAAVAASRGSWGVGIFYFRVSTDQERFFDIYYDRAPLDVNRRKGAWFIYRELTVAG